MPSKKRPTRTTSKRRSKSRTKSRRRQSRKRKQPRLARRNSKPRTSNLANFQSSAKPQKVSTVYNTEFNGGTAFVVENTGDKLLIFHPASKQLLLTLPFQQLFVGQDKNYGMTGNSLLAKVSNNRFVFVGKEVYEFETLPGDTILSFSSPVGNSGVPYPFAIGNTHVYLLAEKVAVQKNFFDLKDTTFDVYDQFYAARDNQFANGPALLAKASTKLQTKLLQKNVQ